jgi:hypothetical protein
MWSVDLVGHTGERLRKRSTTRRAHHVPVLCAAHEHVDSTGAGAGVGDHHELRAVQKERVCRDCPGEPHGTDGRDGPCDVAADTESAEIGLICGLEPDLARARARHSGDQRDQAQRRQSAFRAIQIITHRRSPSCVLQMTLESPLLAETTLRSTYAQSGSGRDQ